MLRLKLSLTILVIIFATIYSSYYFYSISINRDVKKLVENKITQNAYFIKEVIEKNKIKYEAQLKEWALSNRIAEDIDELNDSFKEKSELEAKIKKLKEESSKNVASNNKTSLKKDENKETQNPQNLKELEDELKNLNNDINILIGSLKNRFDSLTKTLNMNFYYLISEHLSKVEEMKNNFQTTDEFIKIVMNGKTDSDIWMRKNFPYEVYGVPIKLNGKVLGGLFVGIKRTKRDADFLTQRTNTKTAYINNNKVLSTNIDNIPLKKMLNSHIINHKEELKTLTYNDISDIFDIKVQRVHYKGIFIPLKSYNSKVSGIVLIHKVTSKIIPSISKLQYWLPLFSISIFLLVMIIIYMINKSFLQPYVELEIETNKFLDEEEYSIVPSKFGEAEGLARSIKKLIRKINGEKEETYMSWDDPLFVTELKKDEYTEKKKDKNHYDEVYDMFIRAHKNNSLPYEHIKRDEFKRRLSLIENRLKNKFNVNEVYFEVMIDDSGIIKLHPKIIKNS